MNKIAIIYKAKSSFLGKTKKAVRFEIATITNRKSVSHATVLAVMNSK